MHRSILFPEMIEDRLRLSPRDYCRQCRGIGLLDCLHASEMFQQPPGCALANSRNLPQFGGAVAHLPALAMECNREAVSLVANQLHQVQYRRVMIERNRLTLLPVDVNNFFALGDRGQRLVDDLERFERLGCGMQLAEPAVDQHQAGHLSFSLPECACSGA